MDVQLVDIDDPEKWNALCRSLRSSAFRSSFLADPYESLVGIGADGLPAELIEALAELSPPELRLLADLTNRFQIPPGPSPCLM